MFSKYYHKFVTTILKVYFKKALPKEVFYRDYKNFNNENFNKELHTNFDGLIKTITFENTFLEILNVHAPVNYFELYIKKTEKL